VAALETHPELKDEMEAFEQALRVVDEKADGDPK